MTQIMDRTVKWLAELPDNYELKDVTDQFEKAAEGRGMCGLMFIGLQPLGGPGMLCDIQEIRATTQEGYIQLAVDLVYKEMVYVRVNR